MASGFEGAAECQARFYFSDLASWVKDLHSAHLSITSAFSSLLKEYETVFPSSGLQLYPRNRPLHGPTALYWGEIVTLRVRSRLGRLESKKVVRHLTGGFQVGWVFTLAKRSDMSSRFLDFDRRRLALNLASRSVLSALNHLRTATTRRFPPTFPLTVPSGLDPDLRRQVPEMPADLLPIGLPSRLIQFLRSGWISAFSLALAEEECCELALEIAENPSAKGLKLDLSDRKKKSVRRHVRWVNTRTGELFSKLTYRLMRTLHLPEGIGPVVSLKERKRRRLEKAFAFSGESLDSIRRKCEAAQIAVSSGLAEAKVILLPAGLQKESSSLPVAS